MIKRWLMGFFVLMMLSGSAVAQMAFIAGTDYQPIDPPVETAQPDKVVVTELFWYGCPSCFRFEPYVERWSAALPDEVVFEQVPSMLNQPWVEHARTYYSFQLMGILEEVHREFFDAIHLKRQRLDSLDSIAGFVAEQGLDEKAFRELYHSFPVETQLRKNLNKERRYGSRAVPTVVVNGKYFVSAGSAGSYDRMIEIVNHLVGLELAR